MRIGSHTCWLMADHIIGLCEEALCRIHIPVLGEHRVYQVAVAVYGSVQVAPLTIHLDVGLVAIPGAASFSFAPGA